jgi:F0F1-type ATP synthase assembly protein I
MADVQTTSVAAIQASATSFAASPRVAGVSAVVGSVAGVAPEVMFEHANVAMLKLTGILKLKDKA